MMSLLALGFIGVMGFLLYPIACSISAHYPCVFPKVITGLFNKKYWGPRVVAISAGFGLFVLLNHYLTFGSPRVADLYPFLLASFLFLLLIAAIVDYKKHIIPDFLTFPMIIIGFLASQLSFYMIVSPFESIQGAMFGYFFPSVIGFIFYKKYPDGLGAGDVKLLSAVGAWMGINGLAYSIIVSTVLFAAYALLKKQKHAPYAPFLTAGVAFTLIAYHFNLLF